MLKHLRALAARVFGPRANIPVNKRRPIHLDYPGDSELPSGLPSPESLRRLAEHLDRQLPATNALALARQTAYPLIHELTGYHEALEAIRGIADQLDDIERDAHQAQSVSL